LIVGGLGGFSLELADWLVLRGCRKLVLSSRRGLSKQYQAYRMKTWESYGVKIVISTANITTSAGCEELIREAMKLGPVGGIFNLAVQLRDGLFENQDAEKFKECLEPKATATKYLDESSRKLCPELQHFVIFSSVSCGRGNAGQTNYGMANSIMERIVEKRSFDGLPAKAIQWGAIGEVGIVAEMMEDQLDMEIGGTLQQRITSCLEELDTLLTYHKPIVASMVVAEKQNFSNKSGNVFDIILNIMGIRDSKSVSMETTLAELGMDSLMTVEIQQTLEREHNFVITAQDLRSISLNALIERVGSKAQKNHDNDEEDDNKANLLIRNLGSEKDSNSMLVCLSESQPTDKLTLFIPGVEGCGGDTWKDVSKNISGTSYILQHKNIKNTSSFDKFINEVYFNIADLMEKYKNVHIVGHSFGSLVALQIAHLMEIQNKQIQLTIIDGSPIFLSTLVKDHLGTHNFEEIIETLILKTVVENTIPNETIKVLHIIQSNNTLVQKISALMNEFDGLKIYSEGHIKEMVDVIKYRSLLIYNLDVNNFYKLDKTKIRLIRPHSSSIKNIDVDYGLKQFATLPVDVKFINGDHTSMLDTEEFRNLLKDVP
jgi:fatty acid synthase